MLRRSLIGLLIAVALLALLVTAVVAQTAVDDEPAEAPSIEPMGGGVVQTIPFTLTINVPGPDGEQTIEVPVVLSLDIQIALGNVLTASVAVSPEIAEAGEAATAELVEAEPTAAPVTPTTAARTPVQASPTPTRVPPTPVPAEPTTAPTEAAPTVAPTEAPQEPTEEATVEPPEDATPEPDEPVAIDPDACSDPRSVIHAPAAGDVISGTVEVYGTARHELFNYYKLEYLQDGSATGEFAFIMDSSSPVTDGLLAELDSTEMDNGGYTLRLTVVDNTGNFPPPCLVPVEIAN